MMSVHRIALALTFFALLSCVGSGVQKQADAVRVDIDKARKSGAYQCAPQELALAETSVDFAENELAEGDYMRAREHIELAVTNANAALANSKECAPKRVVIRTQTDKDGDGLLDDVDACPERAEDRDLFEDGDGCPDPDNDKDNILDPLDRCPNTPGFAENAGCPHADKDEDGIHDQDDACPQAPEDIDGVSDADGRPDLDIDNDGVEDCVEGCPPAKSADGTVPLCDRCTQGTPEQTREDADQFEDQDGCPDIDNDKDGLLDTIDKCPLQPGPPSTSGCPDEDGDGFADALDACPDALGVSWAQNPEWKLKNSKGGDGCPPMLTLVVIKKDRIEIKQQVQFDTGMATIKPISAKLLAEVGTVLRASPDIKKVSIEGHTDDVGDDETNLKLSQSRADSVRRWLIDKEKLNPELLVAVGLGEDKPIASNRTKMGRQQNRRSEFNVERQD